MRIRSAAHFRLRHVADDDAGVLSFRRSKPDQWRSDVDDVARLCEQHLDTSRQRRWHVDDGLVGFDGDQRLLGDDAIADVDMPTHDFRVMQALTEIGQIEGRCRH